MAAAPVTYFSLLQWRMEEQRLAANAHFKTGNLAAAVDLYLNASKLYDDYNTKPNNEQLATDQASSGTPSSSPLPTINTASSPAMIRAALLDELTKSVGNACTSLYKLQRYEECAAVAKTKGIERNPYFAKGHAFVGMSNINLIANAVFSPQLKGAVLDAMSVDETVVAAQRLHEAVQRLFTAMLLLPAMAAQVKAPLAEALQFIKTLQSLKQSKEAAATPVIEVTNATGGHGNGVVAKVAIPTGTLLARLSNPFSVAPYDGYKKHVCIACGIPIVSEALQEETSGGGAEAAAAAKGKQQKSFGCDACRCVRYCSAACQNRYHVPRHLLHECSFMLKLKVMCENIAEKEIEVPDEFAELATHAITTISGLLVLKSNPLAFFDPTNKKLKEQLEAEQDSNKKKSDNDGDGDDAAKKKEQTNETIITKAYQIRKTLLALESHSVEVAQSMHPTVPLLCEIFSVNTIGDRGALSTLSAPPYSPTANNNDMPEIDEHLVAAAIGIVRCNSMEIADPSGLGVAQGLFSIPVNYLNLFTVNGGEAGASSSAPVPHMLSPCHFNHSCDPNAAFDVKAQEIRAIAPIAANTEITISYIPHLYLPPRLRQDGLAERFYFNCSCDRCSPYRRAALKRAAAEQREKSGVAETPLSDLGELLNNTADDSEVGAIYDKISCAEKPVAAVERPGATNYYYNNMLGVCGGIRQRPVEEIIAAQISKTTEKEEADGTVTTTQETANASGVSSSSSNNALVKEVAELASRCVKHLEPWHNVLHDIHNTQTFLFSVLGDHSNALVSSLEELLTYEACVKAGVPAKTDKLRNIHACLDGLREKFAAEKPSEAENADAFAAFVEANIVNGCAATSSYKDVLLLLLGNKSQMLDLLMEVHGVSS